MSYPIMWTLNDGLIMARMIEKVIAKDFHVAIGGGVLLNETSRKDLDIFVYPHHTEYDGDGNEIRANFTTVREKLTRAMGLTKWEKCRHTYDRKDVWKCVTADNKRIDFFFLQ